MALTVGSLFAGIGGMDLGLERAGMKTVWQVEIDDYASRVLAKHWPDVVRHRDVRHVGAHNLSPVDLVCGGFPCQDISVAGSGAGIDGDRSGLWSEFARIIGDLRPRYVLVENVPALLYRGLWRVLGELAALGFDAEWDCIPASTFGAPHQRDRIWIVAHANRLRELQPQGCKQDQRGWSGDRRSAVAVTDADSQRRQELHAPAKSDFAGQHTGCAVAGGDHWRVEPDVGRVADGIPARVDRIRCLGNAVVPQVVEYIGRRIIDYDSKLPRVQGLR